MILIDKVPILESIASTNEELACDLEEFKKSVAYDYGKIIEEINKALNLKQ